MPGRSEWAPLEAGDEENEEEQRFQRECILRVQLFKRPVFVRWSRIG
jgi:hypothetical protein